MNEISDYQNDTISLNHINTVMPLISLMSTHFLINSFVLISDMETTMAMSFIKIASKYFLKIHYKETFKGSIRRKNKNEGYIVFGKPDFDFSKVMRADPKIIAAVYIMDDPADSILSGLAVPPSISFFSIILTDNFPNITGKCVQVYKPLSDYSLKLFPRMFYTGSNWTWESSKMDWNTIQRETLDMTGLNITIALVSSWDRAVTVGKFWRGKNSFFWKELQSHLGFRSVIHFKQVAPRAIKSITSVYLTLLMTVADGLGVMPALSSDRIQFLEFLLTGLDSKYQLLVRTPQYVYSWQSIFKPLTFESWMCLAVGILLISITLRIVTYQTSTGTEFSSCCLTIFGFVCFQGCPNIPKNTSGRLVCYTALLFSMIVYQFYTSNFYSLLSTKEVSLPFTSLEQFLAKKTHSLYLHPDTAIYTHVLKAKSGIYKKIWDEVLKKDPNHQLIVETRRKSLAKVCKGTGAVLGLPYQTLQIPDLTCKVVPVNSGYFPISIISVVRKKFPFKPQFKFVHMRLLEGGVSHKFRDEQLDNNLHYNIKPEVVNEPVSLEHVAFPLAFLFASILLSWIILTFEVIAWKTIKRKKRGISSRQK